jgi:hypothetical protein
MFLYNINIKIKGVVAQLAERYICNVKDVGSNPAGSTMS